MAPGATSIGAVHVNGHVNGLNGMSNGYKNGHKNGTNGKTHKVKNQHKISAVCLDFHDCHVSQTAEVWRHSKRFRK